MVDSITLERIASAKYSKKLLDTLEKEIDKMKSDDFSIFEKKEQYITLLKRYEEDINSIPYIQIWIIPRTHEENSFDKMSIEDLKNIKKKLDKYL